MTIEQLRSLTPSQRRVVNLRLDGHPTTVVARMLGMTPASVTTIVWQARKRAGVEPTRAARGSDTCIRGHVRADSRRCNQCQAERYRAEAAKPVGDEPFARVPTAKARIEREIAAGLRCARCWLLSPCTDHER